MPLIHFLLVYDLTAERLIEQHEFSNGAAASQAYAETEAEYRGNPDIEIVLVGADSIETIKLTHGHYFEEDPAALAGFLLGL